jgi:ABC-2 type transport system ATP-binding protein
LLTTHYLEEAEALCGRIAMLKSGRIVALDRTSELLKAASSNVLRFKVDGVLPKILADQARITGRIVQFPAHDALEIEGFLTAVRESGLVAQDVEIRKADLEDVFLDVMKKNSGQAKPSASIAQTQEALV